MSIKGNHEIGTQNSEEFFFQPPGFEAKSRATDSQYAINDADPHLIGAVLGVWRAGFKLDYPLSGLFGGRLK